MIATPTILAFLGLVAAMAVPSAYGGSSAFRRELTYTGRVTALQLFNADTDTKIVDLVNGSVVNITALGMTTPSFNINAAVNGSTTRSVAFDFNGAFYRTENVAPFAFCGNNRNDYFKCDKLAKCGTYTVAAKPWSEERARGESGPAVAVTFTIVGCSPPPTPTAPVDPPKTPAPAPKAPATVPTAPVSSCFYRKTSCKECFEAGCGGYLFSGVCLPSCRSVADLGQCYSAPNNSSTIEAMCSIRDRDVADDTICRTRTNCTSCTTTIKSAGNSTCKWYSRGVVPYCGYGGFCDWNGCGSATCPAPTAPITVPTAPVDPPKTPVPAPKAPVTVPTAPVDPPKAPIPAPMVHVWVPTGPVASICLFQKTSCKECFEAGCGGYLFGGTCLVSCRVADLGQCYSAPSNSSNIDTVCGTRDRDVADNAVCQTRTNCTSCTTTVKSAGNSTCKWYSRGLVVPYCGYGGHCDWNGCGSATCPVP